MKSFKMVIGMCCAMTLIMTSFVSNVFAEDTKIAEEASGENVQTKIVVVMTPEEKQAKLVDEFSLDFGKGVLPISLGLPYYKEEISDEDKENGLIYTCHTDDYYSILNVYSWKAGDDETPKTLEEMTKFDAEKSNIDYYEIIKLDSLDITYGSYVSIEYWGDSVYYLQNQIVLDGDKFVKISWWTMAEEVKIGDANLYAYIPRNSYTEKLNEDCTVLHRSYDPIMFFPEIEIERYDYKYYDESKYKEEYKISKEDYVKLAENGWTAEEEVEFEKKYRGWKVRGEKTYNIDGYEFMLVSITDGESREMAVFLDYEDKMNAFYFYGAEEAFPLLVSPFILGVHSK